MVNEISLGADNINSGEGVRQDVSKVTEQDVKRAQGDAAQAKRAQEEIKKDKKRNNNIAKFLEFLLKNVKNEELLVAIYNTFFKVIDSRTKTSYLRKKINDLLVVGFFAPFFVEELEKDGLYEYFRDIIDKDKKIDLNNYIDYIKRLSSKYHDNIPINKDNLINLLTIIMFEFNISKESFNNISKEKIGKEVLKKLK